MDRSLIWVVEAAVEDKTDRTDLLAAVEAVNRRDSADRPEEKAVGRRDIPDLNRMGHIDRAAFAGTYYEKT